jgi:hypothetical protein
MTRSIGRSSSLRGAIKRRVDSCESLNYIWAKVYLVEVNALLT